MELPRLGEDNSSSQIERDFEILSGLPNKIIDYLLEHDGSCAMDDFLSLVPDGTDMARIQFVMGAVDRLEEVGAIVRTKEDNGVRVGLVAGNDGN